LTDRSAAHARGRQVARERLLRARPLLQALTPAERVAIEETAFAIASKVADCILDEAERYPPLAAALTPDPASSGSSSRRRRQG
jgi:hypothetical protein